MKVVITISVDEDLASKLRKDAKRDRRSFSNYINTKLREMYTKKEEEE